MASAPPPRPPPPPIDPETTADPRIGSVIAERYHIHALLGEGGMGKVYAGEHVLMHKRVAVKILHKELTTLTDVVQRFEREAMAAANIDHPNIAAATDFGHLADGSVFLVLEYVQGISLRSEIADGPLDLVRSLHIARQIASGLASAHVRGIVHRDLKPENVMLVEKAGDPDFVKVLDFGIAKVPIQELSERGSARPGQIITKVGMIFGTPEYMAPEQALGQEADGRADQYALGVILFEMLSGVRPYQSLNQVGLLGQQLRGPPPKLAEVAPNIAVPAGIDEILAKMLASERDQRFDDSSAVVEALEEWLLALQPNLVIRGSRPDASPGLLADVPSSRRAPGAADLGADPVAAQTENPSRPRTASWAERGIDHLPQPLRRGLQRMPAQLALALVGGVVVGAVGAAVGLVAVARRSEPDLARRYTRPGVTAAAEPSVNDPDRQAPAEELQAARAGGVVALEALAKQFERDPRVVVEIAKAQFASNAFSSSVGSVARALLVDPRISNDAEISTLLWKSVQKRDCADSVFKLLEGPMGARGSDILYDLWTTEGVRKEIRTRAEEHFTSGRYRDACTPVLAALMELRLATICEERQRQIERAYHLGDDRFLPVLEGFRDRTGCGNEQREDCNACLRSSDLLEKTIESIRQRAGAQTD